MVYLNDRDRDSDRDRELNFAQFCSKLAAPNFAQFCSKNRYVGICPLSIWLVICLDLQRPQRLVGDFFHLYKLAFVGRVSIAAFINIFKCPLLKVVFMALPDDITFFPFLPFSRNFPGFAVIQLASV